jgi:hypothetical protein
MEHLIGHDIIIKRAFQAIDQASWSEEELRSYDQLTKINWDNLAVEQQKIEDAEVRGERRREIAIVKKMLLKQRPMEEIMETTDLSREEIEKIIIIIE